MREAFLRDAVSPPRPLQYIFDGADTEGEIIWLDFFFYYCARPQTQISRPLYSPPQRRGTKKFSLSACKEAF
jgi:hypothetical protein